MSGKVLVTFFITIVFRDIMKIFSFNNQGSVHLVGNNDTSQDSSSDGDGSGGEWTFFVDVGSVDGFFWGFETEAYIAVPTL